MTFSIGIGSPPNRLHDFICKALGAFIAQSLIDRVDGDIAVGVGGVHHPLPVP